MCFRRSVLFAAAMLVAARKRSIVGDYAHPAALLAAGVVVAVGMALMGGYTLVNDIPKLWRG